MYGLDGGSVEELLISNGREYSVKNLDLSHKISEQVGALTR